MAKSLATSVAAKRAEDKLPPHSEEAERAALGCVLVAVEDCLKGMEAHGQAEQDQLLQQLNPQLFYCPGHSVIFRAMVQIRMESHALNLVTLTQWLKEQKLLDDAGGAASLMAMHKEASSVFVFPTYLATLKDKALRRWTIAKQTALGILAEDESLTTEKLQSAFAELHERSSHIGGKSLPFIRIISPKQAREFEPDPKDSLVGEGLLDLGMVATIGGKPGVGKSRLTTTLAVAGARGNGNWMGYPVNAQWKTLILQSENSGNRLKDEFSAVPAKLDDYIRVSDFLSYGLCFDRPEFRRELRHFYEQWPFHMLTIDPWNDVMAEDGQADFKQALLNIKSVFFGLPKRPVIVIVAHLRKGGRDSNGRPKTGRELLDELSGSLALGSESRTVFGVQPASQSLDDARIVFDVAKANDCKPEWLREHGTRSAWIRANAAFEHCSDFDWQEYENPGEPERRKLAEEHIIEAFEKSKATSMKPADLVRLLKKLFGVGESTAHRAIGEDGYLRSMLRRNALGQLELKEAK